MKIFQIFLISVLFLLLGSPIQSQNYFDQNAAQTSIDVMNEIHQEINSFEVYPNPSQLSIKISNPGMANSYCIFDSNGRRISCESLEGEIQIQTLESGLYILSLFQEGRFMGRTRFIKNNS